MVALAPSQCDAVSAIDAADATWTMLGEGAATQTYRFSDRSCGYLWIALVTSCFRDCKRPSCAVIFGYLSVFCDHKVSKRSTVQCSC